MFHPFAVHLKSFSRIWDVIEQFYCFAMHVKCDYASAGETRQFYKYSDKTVIKQ
jgi:hypothetical protein